MTQTQNPDFTHKDLPTATVDQIKEFVADNEKFKFGALTGTLIGGAALATTLGPMLHDPQVFGWAGGYHMPVGIAAAGAFLALTTAATVKGAIDEYRGRKALEEKTGSSEIESDHNKPSILTGVTSNLTGIAVGATAGGTLATLCAAWTPYFFPLLAGTVAAGYLAKKGLDLYDKLVSSNDQEEISTDSSMVAPLTASGLKGRIVHMREQQANDGPVPETTPALKM